MSKLKENYGNPIKGSDPFIAQNNLLGAVIPKVLRKGMGTKAPLDGSPDAADVVGVVFPAIRGGEDE